MTALRLVFLIIVIFSHSVISDSCFASELTPELFRKLKKEAFCIIATQDIRTVHRRNICLDGTYVDGLYCGVGKCNIFGYDCYGGCRTSGRTKPPNGCDALYNNRDAILKQFEYCTEMEYYPPVPSDMSGGMARTKHYKNDCVVTCEHARYKYEKIRSDCSKANIGFVAIDVLSFGLATPLIGPPMIWCSAMEEIAKDQKDRICDE